MAHGPQSWARASAKEEGSDVLGVIMPDQRVDRKEARGVWVLEEADREGIPKVMNRSSQDIINESSARWTGK